MSYFIVGDSSFHSQCYFVSLQCLKIFSVNRMLPDLSETNKDICVPGASSIIQPSWASRPDSSKLFFRGSITKRDHQSVIPTLKSPNWIPAYYRWSRTVRYTKALEGCGQSHLGLRYRQTVFWTFMGDFECLPAPKVSSGTCIQNGRAEFSANNKRYIVLAEWALKHSTRVLELHALPASLAQVQHQFFPTSIDWSLTRHRSVNCQRSQAENVKGGLVSSS